MAQPQENENNSSRDSGEANPAQTLPQSAGETSVQAMLTLVREYIANAAFFNVVVATIMVEAELALPLVGTNQQIMSFLNSYVPRLDSQINRLYGRAGLAIPAHLQGTIPTQGAADSQQTSSQAQNNTSGLEQG